MTDTTSAPMTGAANAVSWLLDSHDCFTDCLTTMRDINIKAIECFETVARQGSVGAAAVELGVTPSAVSQQIRLLEAQFGIRLFRRERRKLILTHDGDILFQTATHAFGAIRNARSAIIRQRDLRNLILRVSPSFGVRWLGPRIGTFLAANPEWSIRVDATQDFTSFETEITDFDLRYGHGQWAGLSVLGVMNDLVMPMCSPEYRDKLRAISDDPGEQLRHATLIDSVKTMFRWDIWLSLNQVDLPDLIYPMAFDRSSMSLELARQGMGVALDSVNLCLADVQRGNLVPLSTDFPVIDFPAYWMVCPSRHLNRRIVARFADWIATAAQSHEAEARACLTQLGCRFRQAEPPGAAQ